MHNQPGGTVCEVCCSEAPESAFVDEAEATKKKEEEEEQKRKEEERLERQRKADEEAAAAAALKKQQEEEHSKNVADKFDETRKFLQSSQVHGFLFASINKAQ